MNAPGVDDILTLLDWKRRIFALYQSVRELDPVDGWELWRRTRDEMFRTHPQSPLSPGARASFERLPYFPYEREARVTAEVAPVPEERHEIAGSSGSSFAFRRFGVVSFRLNDADAELDVYWLEGYGGGVFLPFRDGSSGTETYGAGRYLYDTVKGADLGGRGNQLVLDFNFAYNPSCAYDDRWACPLAPPGNRLAIAVRAGEKAPG